MAKKCPPSSLIPTPCDCRKNCVRRGSYFRESDKKRIQRFLCRRCGSGFSEATFDICFNQKKRQYNLMIAKLLSGGYSQRRSALDLVLNRKTIVKKFLFLGNLALERLPILQQSLKKVSVMQFDDMETFEHSKLKPLSITLAVEEGFRRILGFQVSEMPAKGLLTKKAILKYGPRKDKRARARDLLFQEIKPYLKEDVIIKSDQNPHYPTSVKKHFPNATHFTFKGRRGCVVGQGELKRGGHDPLFSLNHTCAMLRDNIKRLARRTWCTTKKKERLLLNIAIYAANHNLRLIKPQVEFTELGDFLLPPYPR